MSIIDRIIIGQTFRAPTRPGGNLLAWRVDSPVLWATTGERFVWVEAVRAGRNYRPWRRRPWPLSEIPGKLGDDLREFYRQNPHLPVNPAGVIDP